MSVSRASHLFALLLACATGMPAVAQQTYEAPQAEVMPLADDQVSFRVRGEEKFRWNFDPKYPRPFFFPFNGPSGESLVRMGHPGAPNHDHHRGIWFAHQNVGGVNFWEDSKSEQQPKVKQLRWLAYKDGEKEAIMASELGWFDGEGKMLMKQEVIAATASSVLTDLELQVTFSVPEGSAEDRVELGKTNFGFLAVRVAKSLSKHFGGGELRDSEGRVGEKEIFGQQAKWMDYGGPIGVWQRETTGGKTAKLEPEGIVFFDHPNNPRYPTHWHVRSDGWMGASFCFAEGYTITRDKPLTLRYLIVGYWGDQGESHKVWVESEHERFSKSPGFVVEKSAEPHYQFSVRRQEPAKRVSQNDKTGSN